ncbi:MAG: sigma 54-interacting transcriptional regulator [Desulfovibrionaceae bacterium]|nr:sigma 54-interacting transcriptional regulator [Desulfovibrionaceae bacterium]
MITSLNLAKQLDFLYNLSQIMNQVTDLSKSLDRALTLMAKDLKMMRGTITLISPETGEIRIHAAYGLNSCELERGHYTRGEGITGKVIETGRPMYVDNVSNEPLFLNKTRSRDLKKENISFICVPIKINQEIVGALSVDQKRRANHSLEDETKLLQIIASILAHAAIESQRKMDEQNQNKLRPKGIIGNSSEMQNVYQLINQVAPSMATVLLIGESGTGKELIARAIHDQSKRSDKPFISLNCAALPESLIESELFGHEKGAFSGAGYTRKGRFELANGGTLFLDEIGEMPVVMQAKILRVLQSLTFERVGGMETQKVDVRLICATNRDLSQMVADGNFRRDLYFRINVFPIFLPALRERKSDILPLCNYFLKKFSQDGPPIRLSYEAMDFLENYTWPGNVRELENVLERAVLLLAKGSLILPSHLPKEIIGTLPDNKNSASTDNSQNLKQQLEMIEKNALINALTNTNGHIGTAAHTLGYTERMMNLRMKKYNLSFKTFRKSSDT